MPLFFSFFAHTNRIIMRHAYYFRNLSTAPPSYITNFHNNILVTSVIFTWQHKATKGERKASIRKSKNNLTFAGKQRGVGSSLPQNQASGINIVSSPLKTHSFYGILVIVTLINKYKISLNDFKQNKNTYKTRYIKEGTKFF